MAVIVILEHELQRDLRLPYMVYALAERWRARGHVVVVHHGSENPPPGDLAVLNVDLTVTPEEYRAMVRQYPKVVNGKVFDISKPRFSRILLSRDSDWKGRVIVKTTTNFGGKPEQLLRSRALQRGLPCAIPHGAALAEYPIFQRLEEVPEGIWLTPGLVVEKFLPEHDGRGYYIRFWTFFGNRGTSTRYLSSHPLAKGNTLVERQEVELPGEIREWRERLGFDFGKFDFVLNDGKYLLLDVNRTPAFPSTLNAMAGPTIDILASGIEAFLP